MAWCHSATRLLCSRLTISVIPPASFKFTTCRPIVTNVIRNKKHLFTNRVPLLQCCRLYQGDDATCLASDITKSSGLDTRKYLLSIGVNAGRIGQHSRSIFQQDEKEVQGIVSLLEKNGFTSDEIVALIEKNALLLMFDKHELQMRLSMFVGLGIKLPDIVKMSQLVLFSDLDIIVANIQLMQELLCASPKWISSLLKYKPQVFQNTCDFTHDEIRDNIIMIRKLLLHHGCVEVENVLRQIMRDDYRLFRTTQSQVRLVVDFLMEQGITGEDLVYVIKRSANIFQSTPEQLRQRMMNLQEKLEITESEVLKFVIRYPRALGMNSKNLDKHIKFFDDRVIDVTYIIDFPYVLWVSVKKLEKRYKEQEDLGLFPTSTMHQILANMHTSTKDFNRKMDNFRKKKKDSERDAESDKKKSSAKSRRKT
ncbi:transcription termination factor 1, mitochondrial-like [Amphiura filiformis]|uniref:transcription termination factor 1, mitochondrial-like n=1 Tax=Amphiura filiformis TaxID=82378 RepID=UPI003B215198